MGLFITFEGIEGCGKSTQMGLLKARLDKKGEKAVAVREPGGTGAGERVRSILLNSGGEGLDPWAELFLYEACRAQLVKEVIRPALEAGVTVICDRFIDSTLAYQGYGRGLDLEAVRTLNRLATGGLVPDVTILLDYGVEEGLKRAFGRMESAKGEREDRFEKEAVAFHRRVREGYLELSRIEARIKRVDASAEISSIHKEICDIITDMASGKGQRG
ncbi:MAG: dTMP kinase [Deltaproteobacteria bacterium]|nr:dTMP kinase [Deltaproteobacteria bacterium]